MDYIATLWQVSPLLFLTGYAVVGITTWYVILRFAYDDFEDVIETTLTVLPGGRARYRKALQDTPSGLMSQNGVETYLYRDEVSMRLWMQIYPIWVTLIWLSHLVPLFAWPLLLIIPIGFALLGLVVNLVILAVELIHEAWVKITNQN
jgi:hypothetical protein